ncbi:MAG: NADH-quinone oxidoreductase subunit NuoI [Nitrospirae bacterium]|nr:NADH-quinone oxidoreductase subunit NuoI [Nitrospirota bacterium]
MTVQELIKKVFFVEILKGLALTLSRLFTKPVTRRYPKEKRPAELGFRGLHALVRNPATGEAKCVGCGLCAAICPSRCIYIYTTEGPDHKKVVERYEIEVLRCVYCAFCVEACPFGAVVLTPHYEYSDYSREALYMTKEKLLENWDKYMGERGYDYFDKYWNPKSDHFRTPKDQPRWRKS